MPSFTHHTEQAEHNLDAASHIVENTKFYDWSATMAFYSAVHYVESVLDFLCSTKAELLYFNHKVCVAHSEDLRNNDKYCSYSKRALTSAHPIRRELIERNFKISDSYNFLFDASNTQRYTNYKQNDRPKCKRLIEKHLLKIREWHNGIILKDATTTEQQTQK